MALNRQSIWLVEILGYHPTFGVRVKMLYQLNWNAFEPVLLQYFFVVCCCNGVFSKLWKGEGLLSSSFSQFLSWLVIYTKSLLLSSLFFFFFASFLLPLLIDTWKTIAVQGVSLPTHWRALSVMKMNVMCVWMWDMKRERCSWLEEELRRKNM